jgi:hypothetical protein
MPDVGTALNAWIVVTSSTMQDLTDASLARAFFVYPLLTLQGHRGHPLGSAADLVERNPALSTTVPSGAASDHRAWRKT